MEPADYSTLSDAELVKKIKSFKQYKIINAIMIGLSIGIIVYSAVRSGYGFFTFFPLILIYLVIKSTEKNRILEKDLKNELASRNKNTP